MIFRDNALSAELAAEKEKNKSLLLELEKTIKQRDLIKQKWEDLNEEVYQLRFQKKVSSLRKNLI